MGGMVSSAPHQNEGCGWAQQRTRVSGLYPQARDKFQKKQDNREELETFYSLSWAFKKVSRESWTLVAGAVEDLVMVPRSLPSCSSRTDALSGKADATQGAQWCNVLQAVRVGVQCRAQGPHCCMLLMRARMLILSGAESTSSFCFWATPVPRP